MSRRVVVIFGPPGAGKTTLAHTFRPNVYDRDDPEWNDDEGKFRAALRRLATDPHAQAVVIRTGATRAARQHAVTMCNATETHVLATPADVCVERIRARARGDFVKQIAGVKTWWRQFEPDPAPVTSLGVTSTDW